MPAVDIVRSVALPDTFRTRAVCAKYDIPPADEMRWSLSITLPDDLGDWCVGAIVGASGTGKTQLMRQLFGGQPSIDWDERPIVESFPADMKIDDIAQICSGVGLSSVPALCKPYGVLSVGEQCRAMYARMFADSAEMLCIDEYTSNVDRVVAAAISTALSKLCRRNGRQLVVASCHKDFLDWLHPDWVIDLDDGCFLDGSALARRSLSGSVLPGTLNGTALRRITI